MGFWRFFLLLSFWLDTPEEAQAEAAEAVGFPCISEALFLNYVLLFSYEAAPTEPAEEHAEEVCVSALYKIPAVELQLYRKIRAMLRPKL